MTSAKLKRFANGDRLILRCVKSTQPSQNRVKVSVLQVIIIFEVSMVSNILLLHINQRLVEIFGWQL